MNGIQILGSSKSKSKTEIDLPKRKHTHLNTLPRLLISTSWQHQTPMRCSPRNYSTPLLTIRQLNDWHLVKPLLRQPIPLLARHIARLDHASFALEIALRGRSPSLKRYEVRRIDGAPICHSKAVSPDDFERSSDVVCRVMRAILWDVGLQSDVLRFQYWCCHGNDIGPDLAYAPL